MSGAAITADGTLLACGSLRVWEGERLVLESDVGEPISSTSALQSCRAVG